MRQPDPKQYSERWQSVNEAINAERRALTILDRWKRLALVEWPRGRERSEFRLRQDEIARERWLKLKARLA